jgi:pectate lyase
MKKNLSLFILLVVVGAKLFAQDTLINQETDSSGLCTYDGTIWNNLAGTSNGSYIDAATGIGTTISWEILVPSDGMYNLSWRYSFGGTATNYRDGKLVIDGNTSVDTVYFPYTGAWTTWVVLASVPVHLTAGDHKIRLEAVRTSGLANIDYFMVTGNAPSSTSCTPQYTVSVRSSDSTWGTVSYSPVKAYYDKGTLVTIRAHANPGYFFESWTGEETSNDTAFTFAIKGPVHAVARFLPLGTRMDSSIIGYATVQDDGGTTYMVIGGALGDTVEATTIGDLKKYLGDSLSHVVKFSSEFIGPDTIFTQSNKTLLGIGDGAHLRNIELRISQSRNVIIKNVTISHVSPKDAIGINGGSKNIVIDHCQLYSDRDHGKDYYDGLLDIKNESSFITVSWSSLHDHYKVCLMASNDISPADSVARITFHHNYFYNCGSRLPLIRFGKAHIFNNYYKDCDDAINSRMGAWVRVERNYFQGVGKAVFFSESPDTEYAQLIDNHFGASDVQVLPLCDLQVPYQYLNFLDETDSIPGIIVSGVRTGIEDNLATIQPKKFILEQNYPNPFNPTTVIAYTIPQTATPSRQVAVSLRVFDVLGRQVALLVNENKHAGDYTVQWGASEFPSGVYFYRLTAGGFSLVRKMVLIK